MSTQRPQPGRGGGSCAYLPHGPTLCRPCQGSWAGKAPGPERPLRSLPGTTQGSQGLGKEQGGEEGLAPSRGRKPAPSSVLQDASKKCFKWLARTRRWGAGALRGPFTPSFPQVMGTVLSPATGPVPSPPPPRGSMGTPALPVPIRRRAAAKPVPPARSHAAPSVLTSVRACPCVRASVSVAVS